MGLEFLHNNLMSHNDLKPSNIVLFDDGIVKIIDFGLASIQKKDKKEPTRGEGITEIEDGKLVMNKENKI